MYQIEAIIKKFVHLTTGVQSAVLVSDSGELLCDPVGSCDENSSLALTSAMLYAAEKVCSECNWNYIDRVGEEIEQVVIEGKKGYVVFVPCGHNIYFLVVGNKTVKPGFLRLVINRTLDKLQPLLRGLQENVYLDSSGIETTELNGNNTTSSETKIQSENNTAIRSNRRTLTEAEISTALKASRSSTTKIQGI